MARVTKVLAGRPEKNLPTQKTSPRDEVKFPCSGMPARFKPAQMRRTLLALAFTVLVSMMLASRGNKYGINGFGQFVSNKGLSIEYQGSAWGFFVYWNDIGRVMIDMLALEIVFLAVLFAVVVNIRWQRKEEQRRHKIGLNSVLLHRGHASGLL